MHRIMTDKDKVLRQLLVKKPSFQFQYKSDRGNGSAGISESYHHRNGSRSHYIRRTSRASLRWSLTSYNSDSSDVISGDPAAQALAIEHATDQKVGFLESLPTSLLETHESRDCVAPFHKEEVRYGFYE